jgi:anti-sigma factor RsiW
MKDEHIINLVNGEIDGTISREERKELTALIEDDPSVKSLFDEMITLDELLAAVPQVDPPASLKAGVMAAIERRETAATPIASESWFERLLGPFVRRPAWAVGYAFATGLIVGIGLLTLVDSTGPDQRAVQGTIVNAVPSSLGEMQVIAGTATADVIVTRIDEELRVDVDLIATSAATLQLIPDNRDAIVIHTSSGTPAYSIVIPTTKKLSVVLTTEETTEEATLTLPDERTF